jgi:hypothetical protein
LYNKLRLALILIIFLNLGDALTTMYLVNTYGIQGEMNPFVNENLHNFHQMLVSKLVGIPIFMCGLFVFLTHPKIQKNHKPLLLCYFAIVIMQVMYVLVVLNNFLIITTSYGFI